MIAQRIGATWEYIGGSQGLFIPMKPRAGVVDSALSLQISGPTKTMGYYDAALVLFAVTRALMALVERSQLGSCFRAIRDDQEPAEGIGIDSRSEELRDSDLVRQAYLGM
jgi:ABC-type branched-subunit amino acid transport system permease subunit